MTTYFPPKINTAFITYVGLFSQADSRLLQVNPTLAAGDAKVSIDGGAFNNLATLPAVTPAGGRSVQVSLSAAEMNGANIVVQLVDAAGAEWCDTLIELQTTARQIDDLAIAGDAMALTAAERNSVSDALLDRAAGIETSWTLRQAMRVMLSALAGKASGLDTNAPKYRDMGDTKNRISATTDASGNRTVVTLDNT